MRAVLIGSVHFSRVLLDELLSRESIQIVGVCTLEHDGAKSDRIDLTPICVSHGIPVRYTPDVNARDVIDWVGSLEPEVIFCLGWSRLIKEPLLSLAARGVVGYHPSALPANRGRHPLIWALALGLHETGSTFFAMNEGADSGNIISQTLLPILDDDDAAALYERVIAVALSQIDDVIQQLTSSEVIGVPQDEAKANYWRKRDWRDGQIDWRMPASGIRNLVRALARPYVGAHFIRSDKTFKVWDCRIVENSSLLTEPGRILRVDSAGILVKCGVDAILLTDVDPYPSVMEVDYL